MIYTEQEMIDLWLRRKGFTPLRSDCRIGRSDGADLRAIAAGELRLWYERLLASAPASLLDPVDMAGSKGVKTFSSLSGGALIQFPPEVVRPLAVKLASWHSPATIIEHDSPEARLQYAGYGAAGGIVNPVAVRLPDGSLELFSPAYNDFDNLEYLLCAVRETDDEGDPLYRLAPAALELITPCQSL